jgi:hypothetical protein
LRLSHAPKEEEEGLAFALRILNNRKKRKSGGWTKYKQSSEKTAPRQQTGAASRRGNLGSRHAY